MFGWELQRQLEKIAQTIGKGEMATSTTSSIPATEGLPVLTAPVTTVATSSVATTSSR